MTAKPQSSNRRDSEVLITLKYKGKEHELATAKRAQSEKGRSILFSERNWWIDKIPQAKDIHFLYPEDGSLHLTVMFSDRKKIHFHQDRITVFTDRKGKDPVAFLRRIIGIDWLGVLNFLMPKKTYPIFGKIKEIIELPARGVKFDDSFQLLPPAILNKPYDQKQSSFTIEFDKYIGCAIVPFLSGSKKAVYDPGNPNVHIVFSKEDKDYPYFGFIVQVDPK